MSVSELLTMLQCAAACVEDRNKTACAERNHSAIVQDFPLWELCSHYTAHYAKSPVQQHCAINASFVLSLSQYVFYLLTAGVYGYCCTSHIPHSVEDSSGRVISPIEGPLPETTLTTDIHAPGGIRTRNRSKRAAANSRLSPRGHRDRLECFLVNEMPHRHRRLFRPLTILRTAPGPIVQASAVLLTLGNAVNSVGLRPLMLIGRRSLELSHDHIPGYSVSAFVSDLQFISVTGNRPLRLHLRMRPAPVPKHMNLYAPSEWRPNCERSGERRAHCYTVYGQQLLSCNGLRARCMGSKHNMPETWQEWEKYRMVTSTIRLNVSAWRTAQQYWM
jgi:hypothetical protein